MNAKQRKQVEKIIKVLSTQTFYDFYADNGDFGKFISSVYVPATPKAEELKKSVDEQILEFFKGIIK